MVRSSLVLRPSGLNGQTAPFDVVWDEPRTLLITRIRCPPVPMEITPYRDTLRGALARISPGATFVWLSSAVGYDPWENRPGHAELRSLLLVTLATYGFRTSLLDLYEGVDLPIMRRRGVTCRAIAHVHEPRARVDASNEQFGRPNEWYFSDEGVALEWLAKL
jgi:hypothetical protein